MVKATETDVGVDTIAHIGHDTIVLENWPSIETPKGINCMVVFCKASSHCFMVSGVAKVITETVLSIVIVKHAGACGNDTLAAAMVSLLLEGSPEALIAADGETKD